MRNGSRIWAATLAVFVAVFASACDERTQPVPVSDSGISCMENERLVNGECQFVCNRDSDCGVDEACNLFTGKCVPKLPEPDSGVQPFPCTTGAVRCRADNAAVEVCTAEGAWTDQEVCATPGGFCLNET